MLRKIVKIDEEKCTGCGDCATACAEGAIEMVDGKARLVSDTYCDGLGACLGTCPADAITIEEREAKPFDEEATEKRIAAAVSEKPLPCGCPGSMSYEIKREPASESEASAVAAQSELTHWPVQLALVPPDAPYFREADLLLVADCVPFALAGFHGRFLRGRPVVVGCPKLDDPEAHTRKLAEVLSHSTIQSLTVVYMEVPCCSALTRIAESAIAASGKEIPLREVTVTIDGKVRDHGDLR